MARSSGGAQGETDRHRPSTQPPDQFFRFFLRATEKGSKRSRFASRNNDVVRLVRVRACARALCRGLNPCSVTNIGGQQTRRKRLGIRNLAAMVFAGIQLETGRSHPGELGCYLLTAVKRKPPHFADAYVGRGICGARCRRKAQDTATPRGGAVGGIVTVWRCTSAPCGTPRTTCQACPCLLARWTENLIRTCNGAVSLIHGSSQTLNAHVRAGVADAGGT